DHYLEQHSSKARPNLSIRIEGEDYSEIEGDGFDVVSQLGGESKESVVTPETGSITWKVDVPEAGLYNIRVHYYPLEGKSSAIQREFKINQEIPFDGADILLFDRAWDDAEGGVKRDDRGNDITPRQVEKQYWQTTPLKSNNGYYEDPFLFYFEQGEQEITFTALREPMAIDYIELYQEEQPLSYEDITKQYEEKGYKETSGQKIVIQAEQAAQKSSPTLYPLQDRSSPSVEPYHVSKLRINAIGGINWKMPGQWIEWEFEVEEDGLYQIALKRKQ